MGWYLHIIFTIATLIEKGERVLELEKLLEKCLDLSGGSVEVKIRNDGKVVWVNYQGACVLRICRIEHLEVNDERSD